jgi:hypothetical protein
VPAAISLTIAANTSPFARSAFVRRMEIGLAELLPEEWREPPAAVWLSAYAAAPAAPIVLPAGYRKLQLGAVLAVLMRTRLDYHDVQPQRTHGSNWQVQIAQKTTAEEDHVLLITRYDPVADDEAEARREISSAAGLLAAVSGLRLVMHPIFDSVVDLQSDETHGFGPAMVNAAAWAPPRVDEAAFAAIEATAGALAQLPEQAAARVQLALHWYELGQRDSGRDQLVKLWVALEALAMPGSNVRPVNELLAAAYGIAFEAAVARFAVGRLQSFRSRILHDGELLPVAASLASYLGAIFEDALFEQLGLACEHRAAAWLNEPDFDLKALLHQ